MFPFLPAFADRMFYLFPLHVLSMMCAGSVGRSFCVGDSGGPLVYDQRQIGIVSFLINECGGTAPAIYTRLSHRSVRDFIRQQINNDQRRMAQAATG